MNTMDSPIITYGVAVLLLFLYWHLYKSFKKIPHNTNLQRDQQKLRTETESAFIELWDYVEGTLAPLRKKITTRVRRIQEAEDREQEDLNTPEAKKKGGIITRSQLKKYGTDR